MHWNTVFTPSVPLLELFMRGSVIYLAVFAMMRVVGNREAGEFNTADLIVIVIISEAASVGIGGDASSNLDGIILVATILIWSISLDTLGYFVPAVRILLKPKVQALIRDGELQKRTMRRELMTAEEVGTQLRLNGITDISEVHLAFVEPNGAISVIKRRTSPSQ